MKRGGKKQKTDCAATCVSWGAAVSRTSVHLREKGLMKMSELEMGNPELNFEKSRAQGKEGSYLDGKVIHYAWSTRNGKSGLLFGPKDPVAGTARSELGQIN